LLNAGAFVVEKNTIGEKNMEIRRNDEGNMLFIDALELLNICIENGVLHGEKNKYADVYHEAGETLPEGWYRHDIQDLAQEIMRQDEVILMLAGELKLKGIEFKPSFDWEFFNWSMELWGSRRKESAENA